MEPTQYVVVVYEALDFSDAQAIGPFSSFKEAHDYHMTVVFATLILPIVGPEEA